ncbi:hypothetical protein VTN96DRAFT_7279 [Rasamsonia emersonii]|uniref:Defect at low temperature protein 1 n=1 Tax=Rasamsonia emersonii (strain ATCC 16479 / CBS 393.64 / IMI 116815) TaxID=1408163 RepID=A0A0F4YU25_RASE3|nr:Thermatolerance membrane protein Dlt1 [Rasamsonia emersonii CBS 393.64]KKA21729.1 Thermatolerance membrane protein Dlt1 [Rasamsonia emersonii CBS 393.64]
MTINLLRILSSTIHAVLCVVLLCLTLLTPGDFIYQCYKNHRLTNIFIVTGAYIITVALALFFYASRIYTNRTALGGIPKAWIPVEKGDVDKTVRRLVVEGLARSAIIAYQARPRDLSDEAHEPVHDKTLSVNRDRPPWGVISHPGWSSPASPDLPDLQYQSVIRELPHLIEAKAVSLAPPDPVFSQSNGLLDPFGPHSPEEQQSIPDPRVVEILQRPATMGLREYIGHLTALNLINPPELGTDFLAIYERARFSAHPLHEDEFRTLMGIFAGILRGMKAVDPQLLQEIRGDSSRADSESFIGPSDEEGETDTVDTEGVGEPLARGRSNNSWGSSLRSVRTAPMVQSNSSPSLSRTTERRALGVRQSPSMNSLQRVRSTNSRSSSGSVIRLAEARNPLDLPYTIDLPGKRKR